MAKFNSSQKGKKKTGGRKKGSLNKSTITIQQLLESERISLLEVAIKMAKQGNTGIMNKLLDKLLPNVQPEKDTEPTHNGASDYYKRFIDAIHQTAN
ncbi:MAG: hypothetical protein FD143_3241 [Ignavibacteria bacterium]|nr:MAG: hypothetical protein FD143_3241 [Ignavibacteria bacterium]